MTKLQLSLVTPLAVLLIMPFYAVQAVETGFNFEQAQPGQARLSPDGEYIAIVKAVPSLSGARNLMTLRLSDGMAKTITAFSDKDVGEFFWANDNRLVFSTDRTADETGTSRLYLGSFIVARDGSGGRKMHQSRVRGAAGELSGVGTPPKLLHRLPTDRQNVLVARTNPNAVSPDVYLLDVGTGRSKKVVSSDFRVTHWLADNQGDVRLAVDKGEDVLDGKEQLFYRDTRDSEWRQLMFYDAGRQQVLAFHADNRRLIVLSRPGLDANQKQGLYLINTDGELLKLLVGNPDYDVGNLSGGAAGLRQTQQGHLIYYQYMADKLLTVYFDPRWENRQKLIDEALADTVNTIVDWSDDERQLLVVARVDGGLGDYYLFDTTRQELKYLQSPDKWGQTTP